jgi:hypothetical protein
LVSQGSEPSMPVHSPDPSTWAPSINRL